MAALNLPYSFSSRVLNGLEVTQLQPINDLVRAPRVNTLLLLIFKKKKSFVVETLTPLEKKSPPRIFLEAIAKCV